jgi:uncharacterized protein YciI
MKTYFCKLLPPRPTFAEDMSGAERAMMQQHAAYWLDHMGKGHVVAFGPVADPAGAYGIGIVKFADEAEARRFAENDPAMRCGLGFRVLLHPMPRGVIQPAAR